MVNVSCIVDCDVLSWKIGKWTVILFLESVSYPCFWQFFAERTMLSTAGSILKLDACVPVYESCSLVFLNHHTVHNVVRTCQQLNGGLLFLVYFLTTQMGLKRHLLFVLFFSHGIPFTCTPVI